MSDRATSRGLSRRAILAGLAGAAGWAMLPAGSSVGSPTRPRGLAVPAAAPPPARTSVHLAGTDGWASMPRNAPPIPTFWPDSLAPQYTNLYIFGFRDVTGMTPEQITAQRGKAQISAPMLVFDQETDVRVTLTNLGLSQRPDLTDGHTIHWHGFQNAIPLFDGVPELSMSVPIGRDFTYFYRPHDPGTYMYHCHYEDVEHVQMGMTGMLFVRPKQNGDTSLYPSGKYVYNCGDGSTGYDREFAFMMTEIWAEGHYRDAHIQTSDWTDFDPSFFALNGRAYPDTLEPNGDPMVPAANPWLQHQPISSLITCNSGERVLLRLANLGYRNHAMTVDGIDLTVVGKDAGLLRQGAVSNYQVTNTVEVGPGESRDVIFTAPAVTGQTTFLLYDRDYVSLTNSGGRGLGGQMTEIRVYPAGTLKPQDEANGWGM